MDTSIDPTTAGRGALSSWQQAALAARSRPADRRILSSYPRSGTHWLKAMICSVWGRPATAGRLTEPDDLRDALASGRRMLIQEHFRHSVAGGVIDPARNPSYRMVVLFRNPIDAAISEFHYGTNVAGRQRNAEASDLSGYLRRRRLDRNLHDRVLAWLESGRVYPVRYEDLVADPTGQLSGVLDFLEIRHDDRIVEAAVEHYRFENLAEGRAPGEVDTSSHYRRGVPEEWRVALEPDVLDHVVGQIGDELELLGYPEPVRAVRGAEPAGTDDTKGPVVFVHVPKTGGTTVLLSYLPAAVPEPELVVFSGRPGENEADRAALEAMPGPERNALRVVAGHHAAETLPLFDHPVAVALVRDPREHLRSLYFHRLLHEPESDEARAMAADGVDITSFAGHHHDPQFRALGGRPGDDPDRVLDCYDLVGPSSHLELFLFVLHHRHGLPLVLFSSRLVRPESQQHQLTAEEIVAIDAATASDRRLVESARARFRRIVDELFADESVVSEWSEYRDALVAHRDLEGHRPGRSRLWERGSKPELVGAAPRSGDPSTGALLGAPGGPASL